jgi:hypothetical protein
MFNFAIGIVLGIVIATIGVQGVANIAQSGVAKVQNVARDAAQ